MRYTVVVMAALSLFSGMAFAGAAGKYGPTYHGSAADLAKLNKQRGTTRTHCTKGIKKNGKCVTGKGKFKLKVRNAGEEDFYELPDVDEVSYDVEQ